MVKKPHQERLKTQNFEKLLFTKFKGVMFEFFKIIFSPNWQTPLSRITSFAHVEWLYQFFLYIVQLYWIQINLSTGPNATKTLNVLNSIKNSKICKVTQPAYPIDPLHGEFSNDYRLLIFTLFETFTGGKMPPCYWQNVVNYITNNCFQESRVGLSGSSP